MKLNELLADKTARPVIGSVIIDITILGKRVAVMSLLYPISFGNVEYDELRIEEEDWDKIDGDTVAAGIKITNTLKFRTYGRQLWVKGL